MKSSSILRLLLSAITLLNIEPAFAYSFKPKKEINKLHLHDLETENVHADFSDPCCDSTKHKKDCTTQKICSIISKLNVVKSQIATIDSNIDNGFATVQAELDEIAEVQLAQASQIDGCCSSLASSIDLLINDVEEGFADAALAFAALAAQDDSIMSKIDSCCESLNSKIDIIVSGSCDLSPVTSQLDSLAAELAQCCLTLNSKIDGINSDPIAVSSQLDLCCFQLNSSLNSLALEVEDCCLTLNSKIDGISIVPCDLSTVNSKLDSLALEVEDCCLTLNSKIDGLAVAACDLSTVNSKLDELALNVEDCCFTLDSKIDGITVTPCDLSTVNSTLDALALDVEDCCLTLNSKIDTLTVEVEECCLTVNSKLDTLNEDVLTVSSKIDMLGLCGAIPIVGITTITTSGNYCLAQNLVSTTGPVISITGSSASNIVIDLNGHDLKTQGASASAILFDFGFTYSNVQIVNGTISASTISGIIINPSFASNHSNIAIRNVAISNAQDYALFANAVDTLIIENCVLANNTRHTQINNSSDVQIKNVVAKISSSGGIGFAILDCDNVLLQDSVINQNAAGLSANMVNGLRIENCSFNNNLSAMNVDEINNLVLKNSSANFNTFGGVAVTLSTNIVAQECQFNQNGGSGFGLFNCTSAQVQSVIANQNAQFGLQAVNTTHLQMEDSAFNDNSTQFVATGAELRGCTDVSALACSFSTTNTTQQAGLFAIDLRNAHFENCSFNGNVSYGAQISSSTTLSRSIKFIDCQANNNGNFGPNPSGFYVVGNSGEVVFENCFMSNNQNGITVQTAPTPAADVSILNSIAQSNATTGFNVLGGTGLLKENQAQSNGVCGYNNSAPVNNYKFVANVGISNGANPAGDPLANDTNYCLFGAPSTFVPNGPGVTPYRQVNLDTPPTSYWNNITL
jgi:hypothetical protein